MWDIDLTEKEFRDCLKLNGDTSSKEDSDSDSNSDSDDEEYEDNTFLPIEINPNIHKIIKIGPDHPTGLLEQDSSKREKNVDKSSVSGAQWLSRRQKKNRKKLLKKSTILKSETTIDVEKSNQEILASPNSFVVDQDRKDNCFEDLLHSDGNSIVTDSETAEAMVEIRKPYENASKKNVKDLSSHSDKDNNGKGPKKRKKRDVEKNTSKKNNERVTKKEAKSTRNKKLRSINRVFYLSSF